MGQWMSSNGHRPAREISVSKLLAGSSNGGASSIRMKAVVSNTTLPKCQPIWSSKMGQWMSSNGHRPAREISVSKLLAGSSNGGASSIRMKAVVSNTTLPKCQPIWSSKMGQWMSSNGHRPAREISVSKLLAGSSNGGASSIRMKAVVSNTTLPKCQPIWSSKMGQWMSSNGHRPAREISVSKLLAGSSNGGASSIRMKAVVSNTILP